MTPRRHTPDQVIAALRRHRGHIGRAMKSLGLSRRSYYRWADDYPDIEQAAQQARGGRAPEPRKTPIATPRQRVHDVEIERRGLAALRVLDELDPGEQVRMVGNSVAPQVAAALVRANASELIARDELRRTA